MLERIFIHMVMSLISGTFSSTQGSSQRIVAATIATAAFLAPLIVTSPLSGFPPFMTNFSKVNTLLIRRPAAVNTGREPEKDMIYSHRLCRYDAFADNISLTQQVKKINSKYSNFRRLR